jgi:hypothetical protein
MSAWSNTHAFDSYMARREMSPTATSSYSVPNAPVKPRRRSNFSDVNYESGDDTNLFSGNKVSIKLFGHASVSRNNGGSAATSSHIDSSNTATLSSMDTIFSTDGIKNVRKRDAEVSTDETSTKKAKYDRDVYVKHLEHRLWETQNMSDGHEMNDKHRGDIIVTARACIVAQDNYITELKAKIVGLENMVVYRDVDIAEQETDNFNQMATIRKSVNAMRYMYEFGVSQSRGVRTCPVSLESLLPNSSVVAFQAECGCNCMVKYNHAEPIIAKFNTGELIKCFFCNTKVDKIIITTTDNAEKLFVWRDVEDSTHCHNHDEIHEMRENDITKNKTDQTAIDTRVLRQQLRDIRDTLDVNTNN